MKLSFEAMTREELLAELKSYAEDQTSTEIYKSLIRQRNAERDRADKAEAALAAGTDDALEALKRVESLCAYAVVNGDGMLDAVSIRAVMGDVLARAKGEQHG